MKKTAKALILLLFTLAFGLPENAGAASITLYNTGVASNGSILADGTADSHYLLTGNARVETSGQPASWVGSSPISAWIVPFGSSGDGSAANGLYAYSTTFDLTGLDSLSAIITGRWSTDNQAEIWLNGVDTGFATGVMSYGNWSPFQLTTGFVSGVNTLSFRVMNEGGPTGLRVEMTGTANSNSVSVPDQGSTLLLGGMAMIGLLGFRKQFAPATA